MIKKFLHNKLDWVFNPTLKKIDEYGFQNVYTCGYCGKDALPSSGGYFHKGQL